MCLVSNERRENGLDKEAYSLFQSWRGNDDILTDKTGFLFIGTHCIAAEWYYSVYKKGNYFQPDQGKMSSP